MLKIRFQRAGRKNRPNFKLVVAEASSKRDGKYVTFLGTYNPFTKILNYNKFLLFTALKTGAYPTATVRYLLKKALN